jgi:hypothetical protein
MYLSDNDLMKRRLYYKYLRDQESYQDEPKVEQKLENESDASDSFCKKDKVVKYVWK